MIHPDDPGAQRFHDAKCFVNIARPDRSSKSVWRVIRNADRVRFAFERNDGRHRTEDFFSRNPGVIVDIVENRRLDVIAFCDLLRAAAADCRLRFLLANFKIGANPVVLLLADERTHFRFALHRRPQFDALRFFRHGFDKLRIDLFLDQNSAASGTDLSLIDENAEQGAVHCRFPVRVGEENVR